VTRNISTLPPPPDGKLVITGLPTSIKFASTHLNAWHEQRGMVRVKYLAQEHNTITPGQGSNLDCSIQRRVLQP